MEQTTRVLSGSSTSGFLDPFLLGRSGRHRRRTAPQSSSSSEDKEIELDHVFYVDNNNYHSDNDNDGILWDYHLKELDWLANLRAIEIELNSTSNNNHKWYESFTPRVVIEWPWMRKWATETLRDCLKLEEEEEDDSNNNKNDKGRGRYLSPQQRTEFLGLFRKCEKENLKWLVFVEPPPPPPSEAESPPPVVENIEKVVVEANHQKQQKQQQPPQKQQQQQQHENEEEEYEDDDGDYYYHDDYQECNHNNDDSVLNMMGGDDIWSVSAGNVEPLARGHHRHGELDYGENDEDIHHNIITRSVVDNNIKLLQPIQESSKFDDDDDDWWEPPELKSLDWKANMEALMIVMKLPMNQGWDNITTTTTTSCVDDVGGDDDNYFNNTLYIKDSSLRQWAKTTMIECIEFVVENHQNHHQRRRSLTSIQRKEFLKLFENLPKTYLRSFMFLNPISVNNNKKNIIIEQQQEEEEQSSPSSAPIPPPDDVVWKEDPCQTSTTTPIDVVGKQHESDNDDDDDDDSESSVYL